jgi:2-dehydro-3-deoxygalactonokinase
LIAIDWGTTGFRAYRLRGEGAVAEARSASKGILAVPAGGFPGVLEEEVGDWLVQGDAPILMAGMVGSRQGWLEVPYVACPAGFDEIAAAMREVRWAARRAWIVPGLACRDEGQVPDVMRGEEAQILGALDDLPAAGALVCLPGTHSKWARVERSRIAGFSTCMTGELYAVMKAHSILGRMMEEGAVDPEAFADGVGRSGAPGGLLHHLFGVRTRGLTGELAGAAAASYLSGVLIGHELRAARVSAERVHFLGAAALADRYLDAARLLEMDARTLNPDAAVRALFRLGSTLRDSGTPP